MKQRFHEILNQAREETFKLGTSDGIALTYDTLERFGDIIVGLATETVRGVLREQESTLSYGDADKIQVEIREHFSRTYD